MARALVGMSDTLANDYDLTVPVQLLLEACTTIVADADAVLLLTNDHGALEVCATTCDQLRVLGQFEIDADQGPSIMALNEQRLVLNCELLAESTWRLFTPVAAALGYSMAHSFLLERRGEVVGVLTLAMREPKQLDALQCELIGALVDGAAIGIIHQRRYRTSKELANQLQNALASRIQIEQAKGVVCARLGIDTEKAFNVLRNYARSHSRRLSDVVQDVIEGTISASELVANRRPLRQIS